MTSLAVQLTALAAGQARMLSSLAFTRGLKQIDVNPEVQRDVELGSVNLGSLQGSEDGVSPLLGLPASCTGRQCDLLIWMLTFSRASCKLRPAARGCVDAVHSCGMQ